MLASSHVLITGANGFVGHHLCDALKIKGSSITRIVRSLHHETEKEGATIVLDLTDREKTIHIFSDLQPDYVIHLAGSKERINAAKQFRDSYDTNITVSLNVTEACLNLTNFKRLVFLGSCDEYGSLSSPYHETQQEIPVNTYGLSKLAVTKLLLALYHSCQFPAVVLRPTVIYGPNQGNEMFLSSLIYTLLHNKEFAMTSGEQFRDFVYVGDVVEAIIKALYADIHVNGEIFNIGAGLSYQVKKIALSVAELISSDSNIRIKYGALQYRTNESMAYSVNIKKATDLLEWKPCTSLEDGLQHTINHFRKKLLLK
jgi:nucleoside-diphosphate-sugar epimerase